MTNPGEFSDLTNRRKLTRIVALWCTVLLLGIGEVSSLVPKGYTVAPFTADVWAANVTGARGMVVDDSGDVLVVAPGDGGIFSFWEEADGFVNRTIIVNSSDLNHGITLYNNQLYASSHSTVWRWNYTAGQRRESSSSETIVQAIDEDGNGVLALNGHQTRTLAISSRGVMYVSVGSMSNVDTDSFRARIRSFNVSRGASIPSGGYDFVSDGIIFADGLRNEVGLGFDSKGRLWGVENGADNLMRKDLGGDIHDNNPAEELNLFDGKVGTFYGYPFCWSEYLLAKGDGPGSQWAWPSLANATITDEWCKNTTNVRPPELAMQAHYAPLAITFFNGSNCGKVFSNSTNQTLYTPSCDFVGDAFVTFHGSWNRGTPVGFKVARIQFNKTTGLPMGKTNSTLFDILGNADIATECTDAGRDTCIRPVDVKFDKRGTLLVTSDATGQIIRVTQNTSASAPSPALSPASEPPSGSSAVPAFGRFGAAPLVSVVACLLWLSLDFLNFFQ